MIGDLYVYQGITTNNYAQNGKFHVVQRPDTFFVVGLTKDDDTQTTAVDLQVCFDDTQDEDNWFYYQQAITSKTNNDGNGSCIAAPLYGFTGVRIIPANNNTAFTLSVREYFTTEKLRTVSPTEWLVT